MKGDMRLTAGMSWSGATAKVVLLLAWPSALPRGPYLAPCAWEFLRTHVPGAGSVTGFTVRSGRSKRFGLRVLTSSAVCRSSPVFI